VSQSHDTILQQLMYRRTCATGALRVHYAHRVFYYVKTNSPTYDITWEALGAWTSTAVEANLAVICASAPTLKAYCHCFDNNSHAEQRSFNWYHGHTITVNSKESRFKKASRELLCCFRRSGAVTEEPLESVSTDERVRKYSVRKPSDTIAMVDSVVQSRRLEQGMSNTG
jgi:hypothetical protein